MRGPPGTCVTQCEVHSLVFRTVLTYCIKRGAFSSVRQNAHNSDAGRSIVTVRIKE